MAKDQETWRRAAGRWTDSKTVVWSLIGAVVAFVSWFGLQMYADVEQHAKEIRCLEKFVERADEKHRRILDELREIKAEIRKRNEND